ncbi:hypothetical protein DSO57_1029048 [Entomophthora muscae]|uniref:Uncharacterized protein n=1 Tax=Entomophthora muscae TaxID=34485 RepID=A0ACC2T1A9_9FUNG|nr:hypothetical protein DSO57_1029048 [Entomophthora muscae]
MAIPRLATLAYLWHRGFRASAACEKKHVYWVKTGQSEEDPLVISTGTGISGYFFLVNDILRKHPSRTIVLFETPYFNLQPAVPVLAERESLQEIDDMFLALGLVKCTLLGHSFGTAVACWVVKHRPHYVTKLILVDPVCFRTWDASLYRALLYSEPNSIETKLFQLFITQEPIIACAISRHLNWFECTLFPEQITMPAEIFIPDNDFLLNPTGLHSYLNHRIATDHLSHIHLTAMGTSHGLSMLHPHTTTQIATRL